MTVDELIDRFAALADEMRAEIAEAPRDETGYRQGRRHGHVEAGDRLKTLCSELRYRCRSNAIDEAYGL